MEVVENGLSFDDVLLVPRKNTFGSRGNIAIDTHISKHIRANVPIISANMDTVTEAQMAIAMAEVGAVGIIHRFNTIEEEANEVRKVKRKSSFVVEKPYVIDVASSVGDVRQLISDTGVSGFPVVENGRLVGMITKRDIRFSNSNDSVRSRMTPLKRVIFAKASDKMPRERFVEIFKKYKIEKIPIVDGRMRVVALVASKDIESSLNTVASRDSEGKLIVGAAVGIKDAIKRADALVKAGADLIVVDVAHGHSDAVIDVIKKLKAEFDIDVVGGNVATKEGTEDLIAAGADGVKIGIGPGHACTTRLVTGAGVPQLTAVAWAYEAAKQQNVPIIADGGINTSGDIVKALAAGASCVMIGRLLAGTDESPGATIMKGGKKYKFYRGMSSISANDRKLSLESLDFNLENVVSEGNESFVPYIGSAKEVISQLAGGIKSGMSYVGAKSIEELRKNAKFIRLAPGSQRESFYREV